MPALIIWNLINCLRVDFCLFRQQVCGVFMAGRGIREYVPDLRDDLNQTLYRAILDGICREQWTLCQIYLEGKLALQMPDPNNLPPDKEPIAEIVTSLDEPIGEVRVWSRHTGDKSQVVLAVNLIAQSVGHRLERYYHKDKVQILSDTEDIRKAIHDVTGRVIRDLPTVNNDDGVAWRALTRFLGELNNVLGTRLSILLTKENMDDGRHFVVQCVAGEKAETWQGQRYRLDSEKLTPVISRLEARFFRCERGLEASDLLQDLAIALDNGQPCHGLFIPATLTDGSLALSVFLATAPHVAGTDVGLDTHAAEIAATIAQVAHAFDNEFNLRQAKQQMREVELDRARYVHIATHQLREPLVGIENYCRALDDPAIPAAKKKDYTSYLISMVSMWQGFIQNLAWASQYRTNIFQDEQTIRFESVDINGLLIETAIALQPLARFDKTQISVQKDKRYRAEVSDLHFRQAALNILHNAVKYAQPGSRIEVDVVSRDSNLLINFTNYGSIPIPPGEERQIFKREYRTEMAKEIDPAGTGLGLFVADEVVKLHKGKVYVNCKKIVGDEYRIRFTIEIPRRQLGSR